MKAEDRPRSVIAPLLAAVALVATVWAPRSLQAEEVGGEGELPAAPIAHPTEVEIEEPRVLDPHPTLSRLEAAGWRLAEGEGFILEALEALDASASLLVLFREGSEDCLRLELELLEHGHLGSGAAHLDRAFVHADGGEDGRELIQSLKVASFPTLLLLNESGEELARAHGLDDPASIWALVQGAADGRRTISSLETIVSKNPFDMDHSYELGRHHALRGDGVQAKRHFARLFVLRRMIDQSHRAMVRGAADVGRLGDSRDFGALRSAVESDLAAVQEHIDTRIASAYFDLGVHLYLRHQQDWAGALAILGELRRRFSDSPEAAKAGLAMALAHHHLGTASEARAELERFARDHDNRPDVLARGLASCAPIGDPLAAVALGIAEDAVSRHSGHAALWSALSRLREASSDLQGASLAAGKATELDASRAWDEAARARLEGLISALEAEAAREAEAALLEQMEIESRRGDTEVDASAESVADTDADQVTAAE